MRPIHTTVRRVALASLLVLVALTASACTSKTVATVNGEPVSETELNERMMQRAGKPILDELINEKLLLQEAKKKNITISNQKVDAKIAEIKKQFPDTAAFNANLKENNMTLDQAKTQVKMQLLVEALLAGKTKVTDKQVKDYYEQNKDMLFKGKKLSEVQAQIKDQLSQQQAGQAIQSYLADLKKKAKINNTLAK